MHPARSRIGVVRVARARTAAARSISAVSAVRRPLVFAVISASMRHPSWSSSIFVSGVTAGTGDADATGGCADAPVGAPKMAENGAAVRFVTSLSTCTASSSGQCDPAPVRRWNDRRRMKVSEVTCGTPSCAAASAGAWSRACCHVRRSWQSLTSVIHCGAPTRPRRSAATRSSTAGGGRDVAARVTTGDGTTDRPEVAGVGAASAAGVREDAG